MKKEKKVKLFFKNIHIWTIFKRRSQEKDTTYVNHIFCLLQRTVLRLNAMKLNIYF